MQRIRMELVLRTEARCLLFNHMSDQRCLGSPFAIRSRLASCFGFLLQLFICLHTIQEILTAGAVFDLFNTHRHTFGKDAASNTLVDDDTDSVLRNVEYSASLTVVGLMRHTLLESAISLNVDNIAMLVDLQVCRQMLHALLFVGT